MTSRPIQKKTGGRSQGSGGASRKRSTRSFIGPLQVLAYNRGLTFLLDGLERLEYRVILPPDMRDYVTDVVEQLWYGVEKIADLSPMQIQASIRGRISRLRDGAD